MKCGNCDKDFLTSPVCPICYTNKVIRASPNHYSFFEYDFKDIKREMVELRKDLENNTDFTFFNWDTREYTSNDPENIELDDTQFPTHQAWISKFSISYKPWLKFNLRNGKKREISNSSPEFTFDYTKGIASDFSIIDFDRIEFKFKYKLSIGAGSALSMNVKFGSTLNDSRMAFIDYKHFMGNRSPFETNDPVSSFRLLPYYEYSTKEEYLIGHFYYKFRKLLITQFALVRFTGLTENIFINYFQRIHIPFKIFIRPLYNLFKAI